MERIGIIRGLLGLEVSMKELAIIRGSLGKGLFSSRETWAHLLLGDY